MQATIRSSGRWKLPLSEQVFMAVIVAACCAVMAAVVPFVASRFFDITYGGWQIVAGASIWYVGGISGWMVFTTIPLYIAHGRTRQEGFLAWLITGAGVVATAAIVITTGFPLERWFYRSQGFTGHMESIEYANLLLSFLLAFAMFWVVGGGIGAALYRYKSMGWISIPIGFALLNLTGSFEQTSVTFFGFVTTLFPAVEIDSMWFETLLLLLTIIAVGSVVWIMVRDLTLRTS